MRPKTPAQMRRARLERIRYELEALAKESAVIHAKDIRAAIEALDHALVHMSRTSEMGHKSQAQQQADRHQPPTKPA